MSWTPRPRLDSLCKMNAHDARPVYERWGGNQWGDEWVMHRWTRPLFERDTPPLPTDPTPEQFAAITGEELCPKEARSPRPRPRSRRRPRAPA